mmetsp:Transcript_7161/g.15294  ORF Transcript_7161/g.15294 Transcript_7161/m.15294 type:complete len:228 (+) Transcript_7161:241-924(+)
MGKGIKTPDPGWRCPAGLPTRCKERHCVVPCGGGSFASERPQKGQSASRGMAYLQPSFGTTPAQKTLRQSPINGEALTRFRETTGLTMALRELPIIDDTDFRRSSEFPPLVGCCDDLPVQASRSGSLPAAQPCAPRTRSIRDGLSSATGTGGTGKPRSRLSCGLKPQGSLSLPLGTVPNSAAASSLASGVGGRFHSVPRAKACCCALNSSSTVKKLVPGAPRIHDVT